jgi:ATP-dependent helicase/DNAse subunit B
MRLLTGPSGSGRTSHILDRLRENPDGSLRLLVPTATMAQHLQNQLARKGLVFRRSIIQTLSGFVRDWAGDTVEITRAVLYLLTEEAVRRAAHPDFARVSDLPGFSARLAATIDEFASAGCDSDRLAACLPDAPLAEPFLAVYRLVDRELTRRGLATRARRLEIAAKRIAAEGLGGIREVWVDGFHALPDPELAVVAAVGRHTALTLTLDDVDLTEALTARLEDLGFERNNAPRRRGQPAEQIFKAPGIERESEEIARRILEQVESGRPFREIGIVVRTAEKYVPLLRATLERFGIPARFYFEESLEQHAVIRFLRGVIDAMLGGWDHGRTLAVLRLAPRFADYGPMDRFDFAVREQTPNAGLAGLRALLLDESGQLRQGADKLAHKLDSLAALEEWRSYSLHPKDWAARFLTLRNLFRPARPASDASHARAIEWRSQAAALDAFDEALPEAALSLDATAEIPIEPWWRAVKSVLRLKSLRVEDGRRNVVHVLSAHEARQWSLPVMFVCGMVEKEFPRFHQQDPFFPDAARCRLNQSGVRVRTAAEFECEERALFGNARNSATMLVTLSWPEFDERGESNLKSLFLEGVLTAPANSRSARPVPRLTIAPARLAAIGDAALLPVLREKTAAISPTSFESFLQCPFQYFANRVLKLRPPPARPQERLDFMLQGEIVHQTLKEWWNDRGDIAGVFERIFGAVLDQHHVPFGYHSERLRNQILDDLRRFIAEDAWRRDAFHSVTEEPFELTIGDVLVRGKIDRLDTGADGKAYVIDYKYSAAKRVRDKLKNESLLQAPLYLMAARDVFHVKPEGMFYVGLKGETVYAGWSETPVFESLPLPENWLDRTRDRVLEIAGEIRGGRIEVAPADPDNCRFCDYRDACRIDQTAAEPEPEVETA